MSRRVTAFLLAGFVLGCGDPVARNVEIVLAGGPDREAAMMELLFAKSKALPVILAALQVEGESPRGRADLVEILWKLHVRESDPRILPALTDLIDDDAAEVRRAVAIALGDMGEKDMIELLLERLLAEEDESVQHEVLRALELLDEWELRTPGGGSPLFSVSGGESMSPEQKEGFARALQQIVATAGADSLRQTADEILAKMAAQLVGEGDEILLQADLIGAEAQYRAALDLQPDSRIALQRLGQLFLFNEQRERGLEILSGAGMAVKAPRLSRAPVIDGDLSDDAWLEATRLDTFFPCVRVLRSLPAEGRSQAWVAYTDSSLWLAVKGYEKDTSDLSAAVTTRDGLVHQDDCVEVHLDVELDRSSSHQFIANSLGTIADYYHARGGESGGDDQWNSEARVAARVEPTFWSVEMEVPFRDLGVDTVQPGQLWGFNIARVRITHGGSYDQWVPTYGFSLRPDRFGVLLFE